MSDDNKKDQVEVFEDEKKILLNHDYDGIKELDHPLPRWWLVTFYLTIAFAVPYYLAHTFFGAKSIEDELAADMKVVEQKQAAYLEKQGGFSMEEYEKIAADPAMAKVAKKTYKRKCLACHGANGEGGVGPNLADNYWLHGDGSLKTVYQTISKGVVEKGMPEWGQALGKEKVMAVLNYIAAFKGTNPANAKAPQGKEYK